MEKERDKESSLVCGDATNIVANKVSKFYYSSISLYTKRVVTLYWPHVHATLRVKCEHLFIGPFLFCFFMTFLSLFSYWGNHLFLVIL